MKRVIFLLSLLAPLVARADVQIAAGSTSQCVDVFVGDSTSTTGAGKTALVHSDMTCYYKRRGESSATSIVMASSTLGTYTSGAFKKIDDTNMPGWYEFCPPNAALATGAADVAFQCRASGAAPMNLRVTLLSPNTYGYDGKLASESGTTIGLASGAVDADDQFNYQTELVVFDSAGLVSAVSCITDSTNSGDTVVTAEDISSLVAVNDNYLIRPNTGCRNLRPTTAGRNLDVSSGGEAGIDWANVGSPTTSVNLSGTSVGTASALGATAKSDVKTQMTDALSVDTYSELSACPGFPVTLTTALIYNYQFFRHKMTATSTVQTMFKDNGTTSLCANTMSDSAGTFTRGEFN